jgi:hypothetical protein
MTKKAAALYTMVFFVAAMPCVVLFLWFGSLDAPWSLDETALAVIGYARFVLCPAVLVIGVAMVRHYSAIASSSDSKLIKICIIVLLLATVAIMFFNTLYTVFFELVHMARYN